MCKGNSNKLSASVLLYWRGAVVLPAQGFTRTCQAVKISSPHAFFMLKFNTELGGWGGDKLVLDMCKLRKVMFRLDDTEYGLYDLTDEERKEVEELQKPQEGFFHGWEETIVLDPRSEIYLKKLVAVIEDLEGEIHKVNSELIKFIKES